MSGSSNLQIEYDHTLNREHHTIQGASEAFYKIFGKSPNSVLDVGCGTGTWLRAAQDHGATDLCGLEGLELSESELFVSPHIIKSADLNRRIDLGRMFDLVICLEAAEHIEPENADILVDTLVRHGDHILFSAAAPGQGGTHHVNCQWPIYWQAKFNELGFTCSDHVRWQLWNDKNIEPWYRQNMMVVVRDTDVAGKEPRIQSVIHPECLWTFGASFREEYRRGIERGALPARWYVSSAISAAISKLNSKFSRLTPD